MSIKAMKLVWDHFGVTGDATNKLVLLALADWGDDKGGRIYPSIRALAAKTCLSSRHARRVVHQLIDTGWVAVTGNEHGGAPGSTRNYQLNLPRLFHTADIGDNPTADIGDNPTADMGDTDGGHSRPQTADTGDSQTVIEPLGPVREARARTSGACSLPHDWRPDPETEQWARQEFPKFNFERVTDKLKAHAMANGWTRTDWNSALRKWFLAERTGPGANTDDHEPKHAAHSTELADKAIAEGRAAAISMVPAIPDHLKKYIRKARP